MDIETFYVYDNSLTGSLPASMSAWKKVTQFDVYGNKFNGALPMLQFNAMTGCVLLDSPSSSNQFSCPWPAGAKENCGVTNADCHGPRRCNTSTYTCMYDPTGTQTQAQCSSTCKAPPPSYKCTAGQCAVAAAGVSKTDCEVMCTPLLFACTNNTCVQARVGVPRATCEGACGPAQQRAAPPLLLE